jgi:hypothetical protein
MLIFILSDHDACASAGAGGLMPRSTAICKAPLTVTLLLFGFALLFLALLLPGRRSAIPSRLRMLPSHLWTMRSHLGLT